MLELEVAVETDYVLPMRDSDEFKGFERKKQEMEVWKSVSYFTFMVFFGTFFSCLDLPINVPILVAYFIFIMFFVFKVKI